jgi:hypothetical protein
MLYYKLRTLKSQLNIIPNGEIDMAFTQGQNLSTKVGAGVAVFGAAAQAVNTASKLGSALSNFGSVASASDVGSAIRSLNLPAAGEAIGDLVSAVSAFGGDDSANDWRVRLSLPNWSSFRQSPVLKPLKQAGGLVFPFTPRISIKSGAKYSNESVVHTNYPFQAFKNSDPGTIEITASMNVEDSAQALYWIGAVHYLRSISKMFSGYDPKAGNPPPIVYLNGYGNYVFKNVPVAIQSFNCTLPNDCDYIACDVVGSAAGSVAGLADSVGGLADAIGDTLGSAKNGIPGIASSISSIAGGIGQVAGLLGTFGVGGTTSGGQTHVPTKSEFTITLLPMYSRNSTRKFSLDRFVTGGYLNSSFGYI